MTSPNVLRRASWQRDPRTGLLVLAVAAAGLFALVALALLSVPVFDSVDAAISSWIRSVGGSSDALLRLALAATFLGSTAFVTVVCVVVGVWMVLKRRLDAVVYLLCTVPLGWYLSTVLKELIGRVRPQGVNRIPLPNEASLPSGHTVAASLMCGAVAVIVVLNVRSAAAKKWAIGIGLAIPVVVGLSRVYLGVHWFGDVLAAWLYSAAWWGFTTSVYLGVVARSQDVPV